MLITKFIIPNKWVAYRIIDYFDNDKLINFSYTHSAIKGNVGKIGVLLSIETSKKKEEII